MKALSSFDALCHSPCPDFCRFHAVQMAQTLNPAVKKLRAFSASDSPEYASPEDNPLIAAHAGATEGLASRQAGVCAVPRRTVYCAHAGR
jgi:hypothetical protein